MDNNQFTKLLTLTKLMLATKQAIINAKGAKAINEVVLKRHGTELAEHAYISASASVTILAIDHTGKVKIEYLSTSIYLQFNHFE